MQEAIDSNSPTGYLLMKIAEGVKTIDESKEGQYGKVRDFAIMGAAAFLCIGTTVAAYENNHPEGS